MLKSRLPVPPAWLRFSYFRDFRNGHGVAARFLVPSLFICLLVAASIIAASGASAGQPVTIAGVCLFIMAAVSLPLMYRNAMAVRGGSFLSSGNAVRLGVLLVIGAALSITSFLRTDALLGTVAPLSPGKEWVAAVESVRVKRYHIEAVARFGTALPTGEVPDVEMLRYRGLLRCDSDSEIGPGDVIRFSAAPREISASGDRGRTLRLRGIEYAMYLEDFPVVTLQRGESLRERIRRRIAGNCDRIFGKDSAPVAKALFFGNQEYIDKGTLADFKRAGVLHVLAASGLHVAILAAVPVFLLGLVRVHMKLILAVTAFLLLGYLWITDMPVSLFRACAMFFLFGLQRLLDLKGNAFNALFLSALLILLLFPGDLYNLGFQLSFGATLGILLFHGRYRRALEGLPRALAGPLAVSLSAQTIVVPVLLYRMNEINLVGPLSNLAVVPLVSLFMVVSIAANLLSLVTHAASCIGLAGDILYGALRTIVGFSSGLGLHCAGGEAWKALPVVLFCLGAPLALRRFFAPPLLLAIPAAAVTAWLFLNGLTATRHHATVFRHGAGSLLLAGEGTTLTIIGTLPERRHLARVAQEAATATCREVVLRAHRADFTTLTGFDYLARRLPVRRCYLPGDFRIRGYTRRFFNLLERDRAELVLGANDEEATGDPLADRSTRAYRLYGRISRYDDAGQRGGEDGELREIRYVTLR